MPNLSIIIPIGPYHMDVASQAIASAHAQSIPCDVIVIHDHEGNGAGWARNRGIEQAVTPFVTFLDADDILDPDFAQVTLGILSQYGETHAAPRYAYTNWYGVNNVAHQAPIPCHAWANGPLSFHLVSAVIPTNRARAIGGFDEMMQAAEDADFYMRLRLSGVCGLHVNSPLVSYREGGQRSIQARANGQEEFAKLYMSKRYGGYNFMGCCGDNTPGPILPTTEPNPGDVLVQAQWGGNMVKRGLATGTLYPRTSYPKLLYVNAADADASPNFFKRITEPQMMSNGVILQPQYKPVQNWQDVVSAVYAGGQPAPAPQAPIEYKPNSAMRKRADVVAKAQEWTKVEGSDA